MYTQHPEFGKIVDYDDLRPRLHDLYDHMYPNYNLLLAAQAAARVSENDPNLFITVGASGLAYSILVAAEEYEMAAELKHCIFSLGWTEEHTGSDLLSLNTRATPMSDKPDERQYHVKGKKWLINCSYHADYHVVLAKVDPTQDGPRSLSFFLVPRSSTSNWKRIETHVLSGMVLAEFEIDGPGTLVGKLGHGLSIVQRMANPAKYQCTFQGVVMLRESLPAAINHLAGKRIFGENPINFGNVFRQMYDLVLKGALYDFIFHRAIVFNTGGFLQFHGTLLKSFLLLRINELLSKNLLVAGSKGYTRESVIGRDAIDSFILPVFDGHYTINTFLTAKYADRYLNATATTNLDDRLNLLREELFVPSQHSEIDENSKNLRKPPFFDLVDYLKQFNLPIALDPAYLIQKVRELYNEIEDRGLGSSPEYRYKTGDLIQWVETVVAACELWKLSGEDHYLNAIVIQYNGLVNTINTIISEGGLTTDFMLPLRQLSLLDKVTDVADFLLDLLNVESLLHKVATV